VSADERPCRAGDPFSLDLVCAPAVVLQVLAAAVFAEPLREYPFPERCHGLPCDGCGCPASVCWNLPPPAVKCCPDCSCWRWRCWQPGWRWGCRDSFAKGNPPPSCWTPAEALDALQAGIRKGRADRAAADRDWGEWRVFRTLAEEWRAAAGRADTPAARRELELCAEQLDNELDRLGCVCPARWPHRGVCPWCLGGCQ